MIYYVYPFIIRENKKEQFETNNKINDIFDKTEVKYYHNDNIKSDNINNKLYRIDLKPCSKQCCKFIQWPVPFNTKNPILSDDTLNNYIGSNLSCNLGDGGGCVCITKDDYNYLSNHGQK
jgi:hypothetical protein